MVLSGLEVVHPAGKITPGGAVVVLSGLEWFMDMAGTYHSASCRQLEGT